MESQENHWRGSHGRSALLSGRLGAVARACVQCVQICLLILDSNICHLHNPVLCLRPQTIVSQDASVAAVVAQLAQLYVAVIRGGSARDGHEPAVVPDHARSLVAVAAGVLVGGLDVADEYVEHGVLAAMMDEQTSALTPGDHP